MPEEQAAISGIIQYQSAFAGVSPEFVCKFNRILTARSSAEALARAVDALWEAIRPRTISITTRNDDGTFTIVDNYRDGEKWPHRIGEVVPDWGIAPATAKAGRAVFRVTAEEEVQQPHWFLYPYFLSVPLRSTLTGDEVVGSFAFGMDTDETFNEESAVIAGLVVSAYAAVRDGAARLDHGIEIGRAIEQERMIQRLHDTSVQDIFACECTMELLLLAHQNEPLLTSELTRVLNLLHSANRSLRQVLADARNSKTTGPADLEGVVSKALATHRAQKGCPVANIVEKGLHVPPHIATIVEAVLTESLANIRKHADAQNAVVSCSVLGDQLAVSVADDGVGMPSETPANPCRPGLHFGISNLKSMVGRAGGTFTIVSCNEEGGTLACARIPLTDNSPVATAHRQR